MSLYYSYPQQTFQEVPGEITLALSISGCPLNCKGCHSVETHDPKFGTELTLEELDKLLVKFKHTSCVLFYGGEWNIPFLSDIIEYLKNKDLKVCLYSGRTLSYFENDFIQTLDFIKVGPYVEKKGNLKNPLTNQKFYEVNGSRLCDKTHIFQN